MYEREEETSTRSHRTLRQICLALLFSVGILGVGLFTTSTTVWAQSITVSKSDGGGSAAPGDTVDYDITYSFSGAGIADTLVMTETVPENTQFIGGTSGWTCAPDNSAGSQCIYSFTTATINGSGVVNFQVQVNNPVPAGTTQIANTVRMSVGGPASEQQASDFTPIINTAPALAVTKTDNNTVATPGSNITYVLNYRNDGNIEATGVVLEETVPPNTTFVGPTGPTGWSCAAGDAAGTICTHTVGGLAGGGASGSINFIVKVDTPLPAGVDTITNTVKIGDNTTPEADTATETTPVNASPTLTLTKSDNDVTVEPGEVFEYNLMYWNTGNQHATGAVLHETVPANTTFVPESSTGGWVCNAGACTFSIGALPASQGSLVTFAVQVDEWVPANLTKISNSATFSATNAASSAPADATTPVNAAAALALTKTIDDDTVKPGQTLGYTLDYANIGNREAVGVVLSETVPDHTTFQGPAGWNCNPDTEAGATCTYNVGNLNGANASGSVDFRVVLTDSIPAAATTISNQATVNATNAPAVNSNVVTATIQAKPDLDIDMDDSIDGDDEVVPGELISYTIKYFNRGTRTATGVRIEETVPANTTPEPVNTMAGWNCNGALCTLLLGDLASDASGQALFVVRVDEPLAAGVASIDNSVLITATNADDDDQAQETIDVDASPELYATKTYVMVDDVDDDGVPEPGDTLEYRIEITNTGNQHASNVRFTDTPDSNSVLVVGSVTTTRGSVTTGNGAGDGAVDVAVGALPVGEPVEIVFRVVIGQLLPGVRTIRNQGTVTWQGAADGNDGRVDTDDPNTPPGEDATVTALTVDPVLYASKVASLVNDADNDGSPSPGDTLGYEVVIINSGNLPATGVTFDDALDANTDLVVGSVSTTAGAVTSGNSAGGSAVQVAVGLLSNLSPGVTIRYEAVVKNPLPAGVTAVQNQGVVTSNELSAVRTDDPSTQANGDPTVTSLVAAPVLVATQVDTLLIDADGDELPSPGDTIELDVEIRNVGNRAATGVILRNPIDANATLVAGSVQTSQGTVVSGNSPTDGAVEVALGSVPGGGDASVTFQIIINDPLPPNVQALESQGEIRRNGSNAVVLTDDPDIIGADDPTVINLTAGPLLQVVKSDFLFIDPDGNGIVSAGDTLFYRITLVNNGNAAATDLVIEDTPGNYTTLQVGSVQTDRSNDDDPVVTGNASGDEHVLVSVDALAGGGESLTVSLRVTVDEVVPVDHLLNQAMVTYADFNMPSGQATIVSDDPDTPEQGDPTSTPVLRNATLFTEFIFLPFSEK